MGYTTLVVLTGTALLGACSGMVGSFAVLRRRALMGDALAHASLPGVCLAFLILGERDLPMMLVGAFLTGVLGVAIVSGLRFGTRIKEDAAIGIVLSVFYGAGIALSRYIQNHSTRGSRAGLNNYILGKTSSMIVEDVYLIAAAALFSLLLIVVLYKEFKVVAFDPDFAHTQGWPSFLLDLVLMLMIAVTVVIGLPAVGVVLMAALLIIPAAAARFWTDRLGLMLFIAAVFGAVTGAIGTLISGNYEWAAAGPSIVLGGAAIFLASMFFGSRRGVLYQLVAEWRYRRAVKEQSLLRRIFDRIENQSPANAAFPATVVRSDSAALSHLQRAGLAEPVGSDNWRLTDDGFQRAAEAALSYRMADLYLSEYAGQLSDVSFAKRQHLIEQIPQELRPQLEQRLKVDGRYPAVLLAADDRGEGPPP